MTRHVLDEMQVTHDDCGFTGSIAAVTVHSCYVHEQGGRCEDYPCCGHTDGDGCQTRPEHTSDFYYRNPHLLHEPGSPEWFDVMDDGGDYEPPEGHWGCDGCGETKLVDQFDNGERTADLCIACRVRDFVLHWPRRVKR